MNILYRKVAIIRMANIGDKQTIAKALKPTLTNRNKESKNRRKSKYTLPPFSFAYNFIDLFAIYNECSFSVAVKPNCDIRYTKLLNLV